VTDRATLAILSAVAVLGTADGARADLVGYGGGWEGLLGAACLVTVLVGVGIGWVVTRKRDD
jgi:hypothetical protein